MFLKIISAGIILLAVWLGLLLYPKNLPAETGTTQKNKDSSDIKADQNKLPLIDDFLQESVFLYANQPPNFPLKNFNFTEPEIKAGEAIVFDINSKKILLQKNVFQKRPIASLTKLMTALIVLKNTDPKKETIVSQKAIETSGRMGNLILNEKITIETLLYALLMESSNDAAVALAEAVSPSGEAGSPNFIELMNKKADELGMTDTYYADASGLDPENVSTAKDLVVLTVEIIKQPLIVKILQTPSIDMTSVDGRHNHHFVNTNRLLQKISGIIGGKTGYLEEAGECLLLIGERPKGSGDIVYIILGAEVGRKFFEMEKLISWTEQSYVW